jgi:hypothetical protein
VAEIIDYRHLAYKLAGLSILATGFPKRNMRVERGAQNYQRRKCLK